MNTRFRSTVAGCALALAASVVFVSVAASQQPSGEQAIKYRQGVYKAILWNFGPMSQLAQGKIPYDAEKFEQQATRVAQLAPMLLEGYPEGSAEGAKTRAKPEIWTNMHQFRQLMQDMEAKAAALATVATQGDEDRSKAAFRDLAGACRACHDKFRSD
jgi:cytochrome c556